LNSALIKTPNIQISSANNSQPSTKQWLYISKTIKKINTKKSSILRESLGRNTTKSRKTKMKESGNFKKSKIFTNSRLSTLKKTSLMWMLSLRLSRPWKTTGTHGTIFHVW
jgi:hypothetical protein